MSISQVFWEPEGLLLVDLSGDVTLRDLLDTQEAFYERGPPDRMCKQLTLSVEVTKVDVDYETIFKMASTLNTLWPIMESGRRFPHYFVSQSKLMQGMANQFRLLTAEQSRIDFYVVTTIEDALEGLGLASKGLERIRSEAVPFG